MCFVHRKRTIFAAEFRDLTCQKAFDMSKNIANGSSFKSSCCCIVSTNSREANSVE